MVADFLNKKGPLFDVRSPMEYVQGHIPGAINLPLFTDEERALVGTCYKKQGQQAAIELGVSFVGPKLPLFLKLAKGYLSDEPVCRVYCYRGGMRSGFVGWFLRFIGIQAEILPRGYKGFRHFVLNSFQKPLKLHIIGGFTGTGKTEYLSFLQDSGMQVIDLECLAKHRGSAFGLEPEALQPTTEQFENELAIKLIQLNTALPIWVEDESRQIGSCTIPQGFFALMKQGKLFMLESAVEERVERIMRQYGNYPRDHLIACAEKLRKRLGNEKTKTVIAHIEQNELRKAITLLFEYYDARYTQALEKNKRDVPYVTISDSKSLPVFEEITNCMACVPRNCEGT